MSRKIYFIFSLFMLFSLNNVVHGQNHTLSFSSSSTYAQIPHESSLNITTAVTLEAWIYPTAWKAQVYEGCIINKESTSGGSGYMLRCGANGTLNFNLGTPNGWKEVNSAPGALQLNTWQHVAGVFDGNTLKIYIDGQLQSNTLAYSGVIGTNTTPIEIGRCYSYTSRYFQGKIDEVRIWNAALSETDISTYYNQSVDASHPSYANLVCYYEMDDINTDTDGDGNKDLVPTVGVAGEIYGTDYTATCNPLFTSSAPTGDVLLSTHQITSDATIGGVNQQILRIKVSAFDEVQLSQMVFQTNGTTSISDISNAKVYYTGSSSSFSSTNQFGSTITTPPGANTNMTFTGQQTIPCGTSYLWLTYDIDANATLGNFVDGAFISATIDGVPYAPDVSEPAGSRTISESCTHTLKLSSYMTTGWSGGTAKVLVDGSEVLTDVGSTFTSGSGPVSVEFSASTGNQITVIRTQDGSSPYSMMVSILDVNGTVILPQTNVTPTGVGAVAYCGGIVYTDPATDITAYSVQLNGSYENCTPWESGFRYKKTNETIWNYVQEYSNPMIYYLQTIEPSSSYHYQAYAIVDVDTLLGELVNFQTPCIPTSVPFEENFNSTSLPICWTNSSSNSFDFVSYGSNPTTTPFEGSGMARFAGYSYGSGAVGYLATPEFDNLTEGMEVKFWFYRQNYNTSYTNGALRVYANDANNNVGATLLTTIQRVYFHTPAEEAPGWYQYTVTIPAGYFTHIIFEATSDWYGNMFLDAVSIDYPSSCPAPPYSSLAVITTDQSSVTFNWERGGQESVWEVAYKEADDNDADWSYESVYDTIYTLYNLQPATSYLVKVRAICSAGDESSWTIIRQFATGCEPFETLPFVENFVNTEINDIPLCFDKLTTGPAYVKTVVFSNKKMIQLSSEGVENYSFFILPATLEPVNNLRIKFKYYGGQNHLFKIGYISDIVDPTSFVEIHNVLLSNSGGWYSYDIISNETLYGNERVAIQIQMPAQHYALLDSITMMVQPSCTEPSGLTMVGVDINEITLDWIGNASAYNLEYKENSETSWNTVNYVNPPYTVSGLTQNTTYDFKVQSVCDGADVSVFTPVLTASTLCDVITQLPYVEDFETTPIGAIPTCYDKIVSTYTQCQVIDYETEAPGAGKVLEMSFTYGSSGDCFIILPKIDEPLNTLRVGFKYLGGSDNHIFGYMIDPTNSASFVEVASVDIPANVGWFFVNLMTDNQLTGSERIAIKYNANASWHNNRYDSLTVDYMPSCMSPFNLTATEIDAYTYELNWSAPTVGSAVDYNLSYKASTDASWTTINNVTPPYTLSQLIPITTYQFKVQTNCSVGETSDFSMATSFTTPCAPITPPTVVEPFNSMPPNACWTRKRGSLPATGNAVLSDMSGGWNTRTTLSGNTAAVNYWSTNVDYWLITPTYDLGDGSQTYQIDFELATTAYYNANPGNLDQNSSARFVVLISTDNGLTWNSDGILREWNNSGTGIGFNTLNNTLQTQSIALIDPVTQMPYTGLVKFAFFAFQNVAGTDSDLHMDNFQVLNYSPCMRPSSLMASDITESSLNLSWVENGTSTSWIVEYGPTGFTPGAGFIETTVTNPHALQGLTPNTVYDIYVQSDCGGTYSEYSNPITVATYPTPVQLPYYNDFETTSTHSDFGFKNGTQINKWYIGNATNNPDVNNTPGGENALYISNDGGNTWVYTPGSGNNASRVYAYIDIEVPVGTTEIKLDFDWKANGYEYNYDFLRVYMAPRNIPFTAGQNPPTVNGVNYDAAAQIGNYTGGTGEHWLSRQTTWQHKQFLIKSDQFTDLGGNTWRLYFHWRNDRSTADQPPAVVDNIAIEVVTCTSPSQLTASNITSSEVDLAWTENGTATQWIIEYKKAVETTWQTVNVSQNPYTITNLDPATAYKFRVMSDCISELSAYTNEITVLTACAPITTIPWNEGFESLTAPATLPACWAATNFTSKTNTQIVDYNSYNRNARSGSGAAYFVWGANDYFFTPGFELEAGMSYDFSFWYITDGITGWQTLQTAVCSGQDAANVLQVLNTITTPNNTVYQKVQTTFVPTTTDTYYFSIYCQANTSPWYLTMDDFTLEYTPSCPTPTNIIVDNITASSANLSWTASVNASSFDIEYGEAGFTLGTGTLISSVTNPYTLTNLTDASTYDVYVRANCGPGDQSAWSDKRTFLTTQIPLTVPFLIDFEVSSGFQFANNQSGNAWYIGNAAGVNNTPLGSYGMYISNDGGQTNSYGAPFSIVWAYRDIYFTPSTSDYTLTYDWKSLGEIGYDYHALYIGEIHTPTPSATASNVIPTGTVQLGGNLTQTQQADWLTETHQLSAATYSGETMRLYFMWRSDGGIHNNPPVAVDNIAISMETVPSCDTPTNLQVTNITNQAATATWTPGGSETSWQVEYKLVSSANWTSATTNVAEYTMTGLQSNSDYHVRVQAICTDGESDFTTPVSFTTEGEVTYTITATAGPNGTITPSGAVTVADGGSQTFTFEPAAGYQIETILVDNQPQPIADSYTFTNVQNDHTIHVDFAVGINENELTQAVQLFPNPTSATIELRFDNDLFMMSECNIYDMYGKLMHQTVIQDEVMTLDVTNYAAGVYFVKIETTQGVVTKKFVKQ